jgi:hypothetical protein
MSQVRSRNAPLQPDAGDALPMGAFRPHPSWYEEYWLTEARPAPPSVIRRRLARLVALPGVLVKLRRLIAERLDRAHHTSTRRRTTLTEAVLTRTERRHTRAFRWLQPRALLQLPRSQIGPSRHSFALR